MHSLAHRQTHDPRAFTLARHCLVFFAITFCASYAFSQDVDWIQHYYSPTGSSPPDLHTIREAKRLFVLIVGDTDAKDANDIGIATDVSDMHKMFVNAFRVSKNDERLQLVELVGSKAHKSQIEQYFKTLAAISEPTDAICFYYSGHGAIDDDRWKLWIGETQLTNGTIQTATPHTVGLFNSLALDQDVCNKLTLTSGSMYLSDVKQSMARCKAQSRILLIDCCLIHPKWKSPRVRSLLGGGPLPAPPPADTPVAADFAERKSIYGENTRWPIVRSAFLRHAGWVSVASSVRGQPSAGTPHGAIFTTALLRTFYGLARYENERTIAPYTWLNIWNPSVITRIDESGDGVIQVINSQSTDIYSSGTCLVPSNGFNVSLQEDNRTHAISVVALATDYGLPCSARDAGLLVGDVIISIDSKHIYSMNDFQDAISMRKSVRVRLRRGDDVIGRMVNMPFEEDYHAFTPKKSNRR